MNAAVAKLDAIPSPEVPIAELTAAAREYAAASRAPATRKAYRSDWAHFEAWATAQDLNALPALPGTVALYLTAHAKLLRPETLCRRLVAIGQVHQAAGQPDPTQDATVRAVLGGVRRCHGVPAVRKAPLMVEDLRRVLASINRETLSGARDAALLLLGFATALRRGELVALTVADLEFTSKGLVVLVRRSKTDQEAVGRPIAVPFGRDKATCPVSAVRAWLDMAAILGGAIFRAVDQHGHIGKALSDRSVASVIKRRVEPIGLDPMRFGGHSLRAGFATSAAAARVEERDIAKVTGHRSIAVLRLYVRDGQLWNQNPLTAIGL